MKKTWGELIIELGSCPPHHRSLCESRNFRLKPVSRFFVGVEYINAAGNSARKRAVGGVWGGEVGGVA